MKYRRVFVSNPHPKYDLDQLRELADEIIYTCDRPMFDTLMDDEFISKFEWQIVDRMKDFDPNVDVVAYYGDSNIYALMVMWLADNFDSFDIARFSTREGRYLVREFSYAKFIRPQGSQDLPS